MTCISGDILHRDFRSPVRDILQNCRFCRTDEQKPTAQSIHFTPMPYSPYTSAGDSAQHLLAGLSVNT